VQAVANRKTAQWDLPIETLAEETGGAASTLNTGS
jgi:hypothetical protein